MQLYGAHLLLCAHPIDGLIADEADAGKNLGGLVGHYKLTGRVRHTAREQSGVVGIQHGHIGEGHRLAVLVDDGARQVALGLVGALHEILLSVLGDAHGIEAHYCAEGIVEAQSLEAATHGEVLQVVIDEGYLMVRGGIVQVLKHTAERLSLVVAGYFLGHCAAADSAQ